MNCFDRNCFEEHMRGWDWEGWRLQLLAALAHECALLGQAIACLGGQVSAGDADMVALQDFDVQAQTAEALAGLLEQMGAPRDAIAQGISAVPLPAMRGRLSIALAAAPDQPAQGGPGEEPDDIIWLDGP